MAQINTNANLPAGFRLAPTANALGGSVYGNGMVLTYPGASGYGKGEAGVHLCTFPSQCGIMVMHQLGFSTESKADEIIALVERLGKDWSYSKIVATTGPSQILEARILKNRKWKITDTFAACRYGAPGRTITQWEFVTGF